MGNEATILEKAFDLEKARSQQAHVEKTEGMRYGHDESMLNMQNRAARDKQQEEGKQRDNQRAHEATLKKMDNEFQVTIQEMKDKDADKEREYKVKMSTLEKSHEQIMANINNTHQQITAGEAHRHLEAMKTMDIATKVIDESGKIVHLQHVERMRLLDAHEKQVENVQQIRMVLLQGVSDLIKAGQKPKELMEFVEMAFKAYPKEELVDYSHVLKNSQGEERMKILLYGVREIKDKLHNPGRAKASSMAMATF